MFRRSTLLIPAATPHWEVWSCRSATALIQQETTDVPRLPEQSSGRILIALPARTCRTFALIIPTQDLKTSRQLAYAQLEKRGLAAATPELTAFECHLIPLAGGRAILSLDVVAPEAMAPFISLKPAGLLPSARCYCLPDGPLVIAGEQGRLVLWAAYHGRLIHTHIISADREKPEQVAAEIRLASLLLRQQNLIPDITGLELWGDFPEAEANALGRALALPVKVQARPAPDPARIARLGSGRLLPAMGRAARHGRRLHSLKGAATAALIFSVLLWGGVKHRSLLALENRATRLAETIDAASGAASQEKALRDQVRATQERWQGLRMALEPRRYPLIQLNSLSRCLGEGNIVLGRFESKGTELVVSGTAPSAMDAYSYYSTITAASELRVCEWSMVPPVLAANGSASFQIKGKMR